MYPVGYTAFAQSAPFSYSGSGEVTQRNSCISESHSCSSAALSSAAVLMYVGKENTVFSAVLQKLISPHWCGI